MNSKNCNGTEDALPSSEEEDIAGLSAFKDRVSGLIRSSLNLGKWGYSYQLKP
jgi:hypothetical protein